MTRRAPAWLWAYRLLGSALSVPALAVLAARGRFGGRWADRLGWTLCGGGRPLWLHGASVGEARSALALAAALPAAGYAGPRVLSVGTPAGLAAASARLWPGRPIFDLQFPNLPESLDVPEGPPPPGEPKAPFGDLQLMAPPLDFWGAPGRFLDRLEPRALALIETELWPETLHQAARRRLPVIVAAGRLGRRSFERLGRVRGLFGPLLASLALIAAMTETDRERFVALGARPDRVVVLGSPKFDDLIAAARARLAGPVPEAPGESGGRASPTLVVAGSTHPGEEALILSALGDLSNTTLLLAPRHLERVSSTVALAAGRPVKLFSEIADLGSPALAGTVVVLDRLGVLIDLYARADLCLVGGSFLPGSGHNPLEPASQGRPVVFGPHMSSFEAQAEALAAQGAAWRCQPGELAALLARLTADPAALAAAGRAGLELVAGLEPVAPALARAIVRTLEAAEPAPGP